MLCLDKIQISSYLKDNTTTVWYVLLSIRSNVPLMFDNREFVILFDECSNIKNIDSEKLEDHDYVIDSSKLDNDWHVKYECFKLPDDPKPSKVTKEIPEDKDGEDWMCSLLFETQDPSTFLQYLDGNMKYVSILKGMYTEYDGTYKNPIKVEGVFYDPNELYHAEIRMLNTFCDTCLDDKQMQLIMLLTFKRQLLEQSIQCGHYKDALQYYLDLCRILNIYVAKKDYGCNRRCNSCIKYWNDTCIKYQDASCIKLQRPVCNGITCSLCN